MKLRPISCILLTLATGFATLRAEAPAEAPTTRARLEAAATADEAWALLQARLQRKDTSGLPAKPVPAATKAQVRAWDALHQRALWDDSQVFFRRFPQDPRRWTLLVNLAVFDPYDSDFEPEVLAAIKSAVPAAEWTARRHGLDGLVAEFRASPDATDDQRMTVEVFYGETKWKQAFAALKAEVKAGRALDTAPLRACQDEITAKYPRAQIFGLYFLGRLVEMLREGGVAPGRILAEIEPSLQSPDPKIRELAGMYATMFRLIGTTPELAFTAVDGRAVDLAKLRGKVVLVDFWATWCGPCIAELPNVKKVYAAYHDKGFEVIGIALEDARLTPKDTPEQAAAKLEKARKVLTDFTAKEQLPWPQYFDGKFWKNEFTARFGITAVPAMFLVGPDGKVVTTDARGEKLESAVKRLLKL